MRKLHSLGLLAVAIALPAVAAPQGQPLRKVGTCPLRYYSQGSYCVPTPSGTNREAIQKAGRSCPLGWFISRSYCVKSR